MYIIIIFTIWISKFVSLILKLSGKGSATALPGLIAEIFPGNILEYFAKQIDQIIIVTGTNGKTTTQTILKAIIEKDTKSVISNGSGSNLKRGLISLFIAKSSLLGKIDFKIGVLEIEEATLPKIIDSLKPKVLIVTNIFRDQLDAYGEIDRTKMFIKNAIQKVPDTTLIINADDPKTSNIADDVANKRFYFGLDEVSRKSIKFEGSENVRKQKVSQATNIKINEDLSTSFEFENSSFKVIHTGKFHVYNFAAAILACKEIGIAQSIINQAIPTIQPAFGRGEIIKKENNEYKILLVKNPAGLNMTLETFENSNNPNLIFILNDEIADGRDVSWIWDSNFEMLNYIKPKTIICSGKRVWDLLLRIKYAVGELKKTKTNEFVSESGIKIIVVEEISEIAQQLSMEKDQSNYFVLPTYTAMLEFRKSLLGKSIL